MKILITFNRENIRKSNYFKRNKWNETYNVYTLRFYGLYVSAKFDKEPKFSSEEDEFWV